MGAPLWASVEKRMTHVTPIRESVVGALRNAETLAIMGRDGEYGGDSRYDHVHSAFGDIARLLKCALTELAEPNLAAMQAGEILLKEWSGTPEPQRQLRDTIHGILNAQRSEERRVGKECRSRWSPY